MAKMTWKERYQAAKKGAKRVHGGIMKHGGKIKPFLYAGAAGAAGYFAIKYLAEKFDFVASSPYVGGAILFVAAYILAKKNREAGLCLAGAAGWCLAQGFQSRTLASPGMPPGSGLSSSAGGPLPAASLGTPSTKGAGDDAGLAMGPSSGPEAGMLFGDAGLVEDYA